MSKNKFFVLWLSLICIILFILQSIFPNITESLLLNQHSFYQPYRFVSAIFLHASLEHLIFNLFALILFGLILESIIGSKKFLFVFLVSGILANLVAVFFYSNSLGASGAIFGIIGCLTILKPLMTIWAFNIPMPMFIAAIIWAVIDVLGVFFPSGTGNIAHLSGLAMGLILGIYYRLKYFKKQLIKAAYSRITIPEHQMRDWEDRYLK